MRIVSRLTHRPRLVLTCAIAVFIIAVSAVGFWKYAHYRYQGLDLTIYTNVLWNLSHGNGWYSSIQANSYLGDHVEPFLLLIAPFFRLWSDPRSLLILQAFVLGLTAIPEYLLLRRLVIGHWSLVIASFSLLNPLLWNAALFEFHALAFAPLFLLSAAVAYVRRRFWWFLLFLLLSLMVREDVALIVTMFGAIAAVDWWRCRNGIAERAGDAERGPPDRAQADRARAGVVRGRTRERQWWWALAPVVFGAAWFLMATRIAAAHNLAGQYKFLIYYGWLRDAFTDPVLLLSHLFTFGNLDMILGLTMPFFFLPFLHRSKWILLAIPPLLQTLLSAPGGSNLVVEMHYALLFVPALALTTVDAIVAWRAGAMPWWRRLLTARLPGFPKPAAAVLAGVWIFGVAWAIGPFPGIARILVSGASPEDRARRAAYDTILARVPPNSAVAASYAALPHVAARREVASMASAYLGVTQFGESPYVLPESTTALIMDSRDAVTYAVQFPPVGWAAPYAEGGSARLRALLVERGFGVVTERDGVVFLARGAIGALGDHYIETPAGAARGRLTIDDLRDATVLPD
ncbi:DUF2079 domain-containing protein [Candidatus Uhrbacteria bacterium]|nr:DUF2079 domain-containing protein [Candidatus Uhrbacteria bacterium]